MAILDLDKRITEWLYLEPTEVTQKILFFLASGIVYLLPLLLLILFFRSAKDRLNSFKIALAALFSWQILSTLVGTVLYNQYGFRDRPFAEKGFTELFLEQPQKAFPSDHSAVLMAVTVMLYALGYKKLANVALMFTFIGSLARVMIGFHWFGDVIGGWIIGIIGALLVLFFNTTLDKIWNVIERLWRR